jgi:SnoaL-like domain
MTTPIEDKEAIRELFSEYCFRMDEFRFDELGQLFTEDGDWIAPYAQAHGPAEIAALMARNIPAEPRRKHFIMQSLIRLDGDRATARTSYLVLLQASGAGLVPSVAGTYEDRLVRTTGGWRFRKRRLVHDLVAELGLNLPGTRRSPAGA